MLRITDLNAYYDHGNTASHVLRGLSCLLNQSRIVAVLGRNGVGRSTLAKSVMGLVRCTGSIQKYCVYRQSWHELIGLMPHEIAHLGLGYVPEQRGVFPSLTVEQNLLLGIKPKQGQHRLLSRLTQPEVWSIERIYGLFPMLAKRRLTLAGVLSGGEQQVLSIARSLMGNPDCLVVDEPTEGLSPSLVGSVADCLTALRNSGVAVLLIEQKLQMALSIADYVYVMGYGTVVFKGTVDEFNANLDIKRQWLEVA